MRAASRWNASPPGSALEVHAFELIPDERGRIEELLLRYSDEEACELILTSGGTGVAPSDVTPEATLRGDRAPRPRDSRGDARGISARTPPTGCSRGRRPASAGAA